MTTAANGDREPIGAVLFGLWDVIAAAFSTPDSSDNVRSDNNFREVVALQGFIMAQIGGLLIYVHGEPDKVELRVVVTYLGVFLIPLIGLLAIGLSYQSVDGQRRYVYSLPVRRYSFFAFALSLGIVPTTAYYYWHGGLPGQAEVSLVDVHSLTITRTGEKITGAEFRIVLSDVEAARPWKVTVSLCGRSVERWRIMQVNGFLDRDRNEQWRALGRNDPGDEPDQGDALWIGTIVSATPGVYWVQVALEPKVAAADSREEFPKDDLHVKVTAL